MNKSIIAAFAVAATIAAPTFAFAQSANGPVSRAEVKSDLVQIERAGYNANADRTTYPVGAQVAEKRVSAQQPAYVQSSGASIYGSSNTGSTGASRGERNAYTNVNGIDYGRP